MRGDTAVTLRLLLRRPGLAGLVAGFGGGAALLALLLPWHELVTTVELLDLTSRRVEARTVGSATPWGWVAALSGALAVWLAGGVAFDRPVRWAPGGLLLAAALLAVGGLGALLLLPSVESYVAASDPLHRVAEQLPEGVGLQLHVRASIGPWLTLGGAVSVAVGALNAHDR